MIRPGISFFLLQKPNAATEYPEAVPNGVCGKGARNGMLGVLASKPHWSAGVPPAKQNHEAGGTTSAPMRYEPHPVDLL
jgi:hypothetical protein